MTRKITSGVYRCVNGFVTAAGKDGGGMTVVPGGALVPYDFGYEVMEGREELFDDVSHERPTTGVEQATAAPGETREVKAPAKKSAAKK